MDYNKHLPGATPYDKAYNEKTEAQQESGATSGSVRKTETAQTATDAPGMAQGSGTYEPRQEATPRYEAQRNNAFGVKEAVSKRHLAIASLIIGISSFLVIFIIPLFGLALATVGGVFGIVLGALSRRQYAGFAWAGIILSIISLVIVLISFIVLCVVGWGLLAALVSYVSQSGLYEFPKGFYNGFYLR